MGLAADALAGAGLMRRMSLGDFARLVERTAQRAPRAERLALAQAGARLAGYARSYIGEYQVGVGGFPSWEPLAAATREQKTRLGYAPPDNPLLRTGEMRLSLRWTVAGRAAVIGSDDPVARWQEFGTSGRNPIPPRPFVGPAVYRHGHEEARFVFRAALAPLLRGNP